MTPVSSLSLFVRGMLKHRQVSMEIMDLWAEVQNTDSHRIILCDKVRTACACFALVVVVTFTAFIPMYLSSEVPTYLKVLLGVISLVCFIASSICSFYMTHRLGGIDLRFKEDVKLLYKELQSDWEAYSTPPSRTDVRRMIVQNLTALTRTVYFAETIMRDPRASFENILRSGQNRESANSMFESRYRLFGRFDLVDPDKSIYYENGRDTEKMLASLPRS
jgi:hypothetical protein